MNILDIAADCSRLNEVMEFVGTHLDRAGCRGKTRTQVELAVEEIFVNIAQYAYRPESGQASVRCEVVESPSSIEIEFLDRGVPYNPLQKGAPDLEISADQRPIGGLGVFLTQTLMDGVEYRFEDGKNILTLKKLLDMDNSPPG